ncbi:F0F1 ATP synthase subunit A [Arcobacter sp. FWKO B]|uniref:F0F1 ATP synthase subunit A n=1 Tax=Arcobacter sp. FWKO B TaxID=2593672 RepID=UPI0018A4528E|nr:F0F1 ATP synthase subunit A [Arcobacter sp. FWKO B]QOG12511.1 F0F1 ATP synthase subunit A [Arcobacter sp. FWKO B]
MQDRVYFLLSEISHGHVFIIIAHAILVMGIILMIARFATKKMQLVPTGSQNVMEAFISGVISIGKDSMGEENARRYLPLIGSLGLFIIVSNLLGILPLFEAPTADINFTLALALIVFVYYNYLGIKKNGVINYFKHFMGPVPALAPLMFPIEIVSHLSRIVSLSFRLFGNIKGDDLFLLVLLMLTPWILPLPAFFLLFAMALLQGFIFMILTYVYIAGSIMMEDEHH